MTARITVLLADDHRLLRAGIKSLLESTGGFEVIAEAENGREALRLAVRAAGQWSEPRTIVTSDSFFVNWADFPSLVALADGAWIAHWLARVPGGVYAYHVRLAVSRDRGATWSRPITVHRDRTAQEHGFVAMVPWDDTTAALVWLDGREMKLTSPAHEAIQSSPASVRATNSTDSLPPITPDEACTATVSRPQRSKIRR